MPFSYAKRLFLYDNSVPHEIMQALLHDNSVLHKICISSQMDEIVVI